MMERAKICIKFKGEHPHRSVISVKLHIFRITFIETPLGDFFCIKIFLGNILSQPMEYFFPIFLRDASVS